MQAPTSEHGGASKNEAAAARPDRGAHDARRIVALNICRGCRRVRCRRTYCSAPCRRWDQDRKRRIQRREAVLDAWRLEAQQRDTRYALDDIRREIAELEAEVFVLQNQTRRPGAPAR